MKDKNNRKLVGVYLLYNSDEIRELKKKQKLDRILFCHKQSKE